MAKKKNQITLNQSVILELSKLKENNGQIEGLPKNPRIIKDENYKKLLKSIKENPEMTSLREILVFPHNEEYVVIGGNMRLKALMELGYKEVPCKIIPENATIEQLKAYVIKDNSGFGEWNFDMLKFEWDLNLLDDCAIDFPLQEEPENIQEDEVLDDEFDETKEKVEERCHRGDIWQLGTHRLMCGDSTNEKDIKALMGGVMADLYLTDPPYNVDYTGATKDALKILNDSKSDDKFRSFLTDAFNAADQVMKSGVCFYIWHADFEGFNFRYAVKKTGWLMKQCLIWVKNSLVMGRQDYQWKHEPCLYGWKGGASHNWYGDRKQTTTLEFNRPTRSDLHPTMKPLDLWGYQIKNSSKKGDVVLDSFGGSGTTIIACEQLGRLGYVMELDEHYCNVIIARWEKYTGQKAFLINSNNN